jgi:hypothetical protein
MEEFTTKQMKEHLLVLCGTQVRAFEALVAFAFWTTCLGWSVLLAFTTAELLKADDFLRMLLIGLSAVGVGCATWKLGSVLTFIYEYDMKLKLFFMPLAKESVTGSPKETK